MKKLTILILCIIFTLGCTLVDLTGPRSKIDLLSDNTCDKPCVLGITPGVTTKEQAKIVVDKSTLLSNCMEQDLSSQGGVQWIECNSKSFNIVFSDDIVERITLSPSDLNVEQLIQRYGTPDTVGVIIGSLPDEASKSKGILVYNNIQAVITLIEKPGNKYDITPEIQVEAITFNSDKEQGSIKAKVVDGWKGYGIYSP